MSRIAIDAEFFTGKSSEVAKGLIGATILSKANNMKKYFVRETESYDHDEVDNNGKSICYNCCILYVLTTESCYGHQSHQ